MITSIGVEIHLKGKTFFFSAMKIKFNMIRNWIIFILNVLHVNYYFFALVKMNCFSEKLIFLPISWLLNMWHWSYLVGCYWSEKCIGKIWKIKIKNEIFSQMTKMALWWGIAGWKDEDCGIYRMIWWYCWSLCIIRRRQRIFLIFCGKDG